MVQCSILQTMKKHMNCSIISVLLQILLFMHYDHYAFALCANEVYFQNNSKHVSSTTNNFLQAKMFDHLQVSGYKIQRIKKVNESIMISHKVRHADLHSFPLVARDHRQKFNLMMDNNWIPHIFQPFCSQWLQQHILFKLSQLFTK